MISHVNVRARDMCGPSTYFYVFVKLFDPSICTSRRLERQPSGRLAPSNILQDLCRRCYAMSGVRRSSFGGSNTVGSCTPVGRRRHPFVQGEAATDPPEWKPADPPGGGRRADPAAAAGVLSLQVRGGSLF